MSVLEQQGKNVHFVLPSFSVSVYSLANVFVYIHILLWLDNMFFYMGAKVLKTLLQQCKLSGVLLFPNDKLYYWAALIQKRCY